MCLCGGGVCCARAARDFYVFRPSNHSFPMHFADPERCARSQRGCHERGDGGRGRLEPSPPIAHGSAVAPTVQVPRSVGGSGAGGARRAGCGAARGHGKPAITAHVMSRFVDYSTSRVAFCRLHYVSCRVLSITVRLVSGFVDYSTCHVAFCRLQYVSCRVL